MSLLPISVFSQSTGWEIGLHDPTVMAWLLVVSYLLIAVVCGRRGQRVPVGQGTTKMIWSVLAASLFFLAINKQLDLHTLGFEWVSNFARALGWYEQRWIVAGWTFASMAILAVLNGVWLIHLLRSRSGSLCVAIVAATILFLTLIAQAISGTPLADFLQSGLFGAELDALWRIDVSEVIELAALVAIGLAASRNWSVHKDLARGRRGQRQITQSGNHPDDRTVDTMDTTKESVEREVPQEDGSNHGPISWAIQPRVRMVVIAGVALTLAYGVQLYDLFRYALANDLHSHIILIPLVSGYLIFGRRKELPSRLGTSGVWGGVFATLGRGLLGWRIFQGAALSTNDVLSLTAASYLCLLFAVGFLFLGLGWMRGAVFPIAFLVFMIPLPDWAVVGLEQQLVVSSAAVSEWLLQISGTPFIRDGQSFQLPGIAIQIAQQCSGIRSTWVLFITSILGSYLLLDKQWHRWVLVAIVFPLGVIRNAVRILVISLLCIHYGPNMIHSWIHREGGPIFFGIALIPLFGIALLLRWRESRTKREGGSSSS